MDMIRNSRMKIQPLDPDWEPPSGLAVATKPPAAKSRLKRLFERQFLRIGSAGDPKEKDREAPTVVDTEPSSVCLAKMVQSFLEDSNDNNNRHTRSRCNCFNGNRDDLSDDDLDFSDPQPEASVVLKGLVACQTPAEQVLLTDTVRVKTTDGPSRGAIADGLIALGYDASVCKSTWEKTASVPAGEYEYIDVMMEGGDRVIVDVDFRSEFEIVRPDRAYRAVLETLPVVMVGTAERLQQVVALATEAARLSLKKKGLHVGPWRRYEYMKSKWLGAYKRCGGEGSDDVAAGELDLRSVNGSGESPATVVGRWEPPDLEPKAAKASGAKVVAGLASIF